MAVICLSLTFHFLLNHYTKMRSILQSVFSGLLPITLGFIIAYLLKPILHLFEFKCYYPLLKRKCPKSKDPKKTAHTLAAISAMLIFMLGLFLFFYLVIPQLYLSIVQLIDEFDDYYTSFLVWLNRMMVNHPEMIEIVNRMMGTAANSLQDFAKETLLPMVSDYMTQIASGVISVVIGIKDCLLGLIIAIYVMLYQKRLLIASKKVIATFCKPQTANRIFTLTRKADYVFSGFISGKILDSVIIGILCFLLMSIFRIPYAVLISVIVCVTNVIPFFGPFIGAIPSILLLLLVDPLQAVYFGILILALQQFDGNVLGPMILGDSIGLSAFWVVVVILTGSALFGFAGMLLGLPIFAFFYSIFKEYLAKQGKEKDLPNGETAYEELYSIDAESGIFIRKSPYPTDAELAEHSFRKNFIHWVKNNRLVSFISHLGKR